MRVFFLAMALYPETQRIAQHEIDQTIGKEAFLTFQDRQRLPYVQALCKEVMRWRPVTPIAVPHVLRQDDLIGDYFVPKGTVVIGNTWSAFPINVKDTFMLNLFRSLLHRESVFGHDADKFRPERFLNGGIKSFDAAFGYGKRSESNSVSLMHACKSLCKQPLLGSARENCLQKRLCLS